MTLTQIQSFVGDLARPFSIVVTSASAAVVPVVIVVRAAPERLDLATASLLIGALYAGVAGLYWGRSWENAQSGKQAADVEIAKATTAPPSAPEEAGDARPV